MRVALCFFGFPRFYKENINNIIKKFDNCDIYCHFWKDNTINLIEENFDEFKLTLFEEPHDTRKHAFPGLRSPVSLANAIRDFNANGLKSLDVEYREPGWATKPVNITSMWNSMSKSVSLALSYSCKNNFTYDRIIMLRTDVKLSDSFEATKMYVGDVHKFVMPQYHPGSRIYQWVPDHVVSMSQKAAKILTFLPQDSYHYYYIQNAPLIPEIMLGHHFLSSNLEIVCSGMEYRREYKFWNDDGKI
jgi:hypothetical protein